MTDRHALIIEDNFLNIEVLRMLLEAEAVRTTAVESVRQLPEVLATTGAIDIVFLDLEFPTGDGFAALPLLRADVRLTGVPIVAYTVHTSEIDRARQAGFHSFLAKPLDVTRFPGQLRRILNNIPVWEAF